MLGCYVVGEAVRRRVEEQMELWDVTPRWVVPVAEQGGVINGYDHPHRLGADRWVALVGARARLVAAAAAAGTAQRPAPALVVMVGTAVTIDALDADGRFLGGLILPGFGLMLRALEMGTAGLKVPTGETTDFPTNTSDALMSGGVFAIAGAIDRQMRRLRERTGRTPALYITGGAAVKLAPTLEHAFELVDTLIFEGLLRLDALRG
jgi:type III pantothenate kinase